MKLSYFFISSWLTEAVYGFKQFIEVINPQC